MKATEPAGPLSGFRVIELGSTVAGPFCARLLADFGAEVIKVEPPEGDILRHMGADLDGVSMFGTSVLRNKRLITVDMKREEGRVLVRRLAASSDAIVENFRPGTLEKWGLGYGTLSADNPGLVLVRISGYGQTGPYRDRPGYGVIGEAIGGLRELTGDPDRPPARVGVALTDCIAALYAAWGATMALLERERTGRGQVIDTALYEAAFSFLEPHIPAYAALQKVPTRAGSALPLHAPNNLYPTRDGGHVLIAAGTKAIFQRLCDAIGQPELTDDARFDTPDHRKNNAAALDDLIAGWTRTLDQADAYERLVAAEVPTAPIYTIADIFKDPQYRARDMLLQVAEQTLGQVTLPGIVPKLSQSPGAVRWAGRHQGADTRDVLHDVLGLPAEEIESLLSERVVLDDTASRA